MTHFLDEIYYLLDAFATIARFAQNLHNAVGAARAADSIDSNPSTSRLKRKTDEDNIKKFHTLLLPSVCNTSRSSLTLAPPRPMMQPIWL